MAIIYVLNSTLGSSLPSGAITFIAKDFKVTQEMQYPLPISCFLAGYMRSAVGTLWSKIRFAGVLCHVDHLHPGLRSSPQLASLAVFPFHVWTTVFRPHRHRRRALR